MKSSRAAVDLIVAHEIGSKELYNKKYRRPEWPGVASGITVGIGYDLGYNTRETIRNDWSPHLPADMVAKMMMFAGITKGAAKQVLSKARAGIDVPWEAAMEVFMAVSLPKFEAIVLRACPGSEKLPAGCFGVLTSITYNRGASYSKSGDRYREMRNIRAHIVTGRWDLVPAEIRSMKRIWAGDPNARGLLRRRDEEAALWEASLRAAPMPTPDPRRVDTGDDKEQLPEEVTNEVDTTDAETKINVQPSRARYSLEVELIQKALISMKYFEVGEPDGKIGGKFVAGVAAFMTDRGKDPNRGKLTPELKAEINAAMTEKLADGTPWSRPIAPTRANATAKDIAPTVASVNATWYTKLLAWIMGVPAGLGAGLKGLFGEDTTGGYIQQIKDIFAAIPTELYLLAVVALAVGIYLAAKKAQDATVKDYQQGKIN